MRVILKPAGVMIVLGSIAVLVSLVLARQAKDRARDIPETAPIAGLQTRKVGRTPKSIFDTADKMTVVDLSDAGAVDWVHWDERGNQGMDRKAGVDPVIGKFETVQPGGKLVSEGKKGPSRGFTWSDGTPNRATKLTYSGAHVGKKNGFKLTVPADEKEHTLVVFVGGWKAIPNFSAFLSDGTPTQVGVKDIALGSGYYSRAYQVTYKASSPKQKLTVIWRMEDGEGNISLQGAALR